MYTPFSEIRTKSDIAPLLVNDEDLMIPLCNGIRLVMEKCINPYEPEGLCYNRNEATIVGLFVKIYKYWKECILLYESQKIDMYVLYTRVLNEAYIKMKNLIFKGEEAQKMFRLYSYKERHEQYTKTKDSSNKEYSVTVNKFLIDLRVPYG